MSIPTVPTLFSTTPKGKTDAMSQLPAAMAALSTRGRWGSLLLSPDLNRDTKSVHSVPIKGRSEKELLTLLARSNEMLSAVTAERDLLAKDNASLVARLQDLPDLRDRVPQATEATEVARAAVPSGFATVAEIGAQYRTLMHEGRQRCLDSFVDAEEFCRKSAGSSPTPAGDRLPLTMIDAETLLRDVFQHAHSATGLALRDYDRLLPRMLKPAPLDYDSNHFFSTLVDQKTTPTPTTVATTTVDQKTVDADAVQADKQRFLRVQSATDLGPVRAAVRTWMRTHIASIARADNCDLRWPVGCGVIVDRFVDRWNKLLNHYSDSAAVANAAGEAKDRLVADYRHRLSLAVDQYCAFTNRCLNLALLMHLCSPKLHLSEDAWFQPTRNTLHPDSKTTPPPTTTASGGGPASPSRVPVKRVVYPILESDDRTVIVPGQVVI